MPETKRGVGFSKNPTGTQPPSGKKYILGIGINEYKGSGWGPLGNAVRDMEQIVALLKDRYDFDDATLLRNSEATREGIEDALYRFTDPTVLGENDYLLIYYSGHGHLDRNERGFWVPVDADANRISTYLPNSRIREIISDLHCKHLLLISDSCFSGSFFTRGSILGSEVAREYEKRNSRWAFCSGRHDEEVSDGRSGGNSPFATAIIQELKLNEAGKLNIARLADKVIEITRSNYPQLPEANPIQGAGHAGGQFVFTLRDGGTEPVVEELMDAVPNPQTRLKAPKPVEEPTEVPGLSAAEITALKTELRSLVGKNRSDQALQQLKTLTETHFPDMADQVFNLSSRWEELKRQERMGFLSFSEASVERNRINGGILGVIGGI